MVACRPDGAGDRGAHRELLAAFDAHLATHPYVLGGRPSLGDCALIGLLYPHLYLDAVPGRLVRERALRVCHWIERMNHPDPRSIDAWLDGDAIPPTMRPIVELAGRDAVPFVPTSPPRSSVGRRTSVREVSAAHRRRPTSIRGISFERVDAVHHGWCSAWSTCIAYVPGRAGGGRRRDRRHRLRGSFVAYVPRWRVRRARAGLEARERLARSWVAGSEPTGTEGASAGAVRWVRGGDPRYWRA
jgi:glutathione S-transferase